MKESCKRVATHRLRLCVCMCININMCMCIYINIISHMKESCEGVATHRLRLCVCIYTNINMCVYIHKYHITFQRVMQTCCTSVTYRYFPCEWAMAHMNESWAHMGESWRICTSNGTYDWVMAHIWKSHGIYEGVKSMLHLYRVAKTHRMPYLNRSFSAKEPCN